MNPSQSIMNDQHRATPEQWQAIKANGHLPTRSCILELLDRIQWLEAAAQPNHPAKPDSSLVKLVAEAMQPGTFDWSAYEGEARAAIREVAAWLREEKPHMAGNCSSFASSLELEAER